MKIIGEKNIPSSYTAESIKSAKRKSLLIASLPNNLQVPLYERVTRRFVKNKRGGLAIRITFEIDVEEDAK